MISDLSDKQLRAHDKLVNARGGMLWWRVGTGKTRVGLETFATLQKEMKWSFPCICLVICRRAAFLDWRMETRKLGYDWNIWEDEVPEWYFNREQEPKFSKPILLFLSEGMLTKKVDELDRLRMIKFVLIDEGFLFKNAKSAKSKAVNRLTRSRKAVLLSGSVMTARDLQDIWGMAFAVNRHRVIAPTKTRFNEEYLHSAIDSPFPSLYPKPGSYKKITDKLEYCTDVYFPPNNQRKVTEQVIVIPPTTEQLAAFRSLKKDYESKALGLKLDSALTVIAKVQQIANGWVKDDEGHIRYIKSTKVSAVADKVHELVESGERVVVWCAFRHDIEVLSKAIKVATLQMLGGEKFDIDAWNRGDIRVCLATEASGSSVNHFAQVPYAIYFSTNFKNLDLVQSMGRHNRGAASKHPECFYYFYQVDKSFDAYVLHTAKLSGKRENTLIKMAEVSDWLKGK